MSYANLTRFARQLVQAGPRVLTYAPLGLGLRCALAEAATLAPADQLVIVAPRGLHRDWQECFGRLGTMHRIWTSPQLLTVHRLDKLVPTPGTRLILELTLLSAKQLAQLHDLVPRCGQVWIRNIQDHPRATQLAAELEFAVLELTKTGYAVHPNLKEAV